jgi:carboxymethylenebutenolidase
MFTGRLIPSKAAPVTTKQRIPLPDGSTLGADVAEPHDGATDRPGIVVLTDVFGPSPEMNRVADRFAERGWVAVVPDLFDHGVRVGCLARVMTEMARGKPGQAVADIEAARSWLAARPDVDADRLAVIGFCLGGAFALIYAGTHPAGLRAASVNYGAVPKKADALRDICPVVGAYGERDAMFRGQAKRLEQHLTTLGIEHDVVIHDGAGHSFMTDGSHPVIEKISFPMRPGYVPAAAEAAWVRTFDFLDRQVNRR